MEQEQHKGQVADLVVEAKDWGMSPRLFGLDKDAMRSKEESSGMAIGTIPDEHLADDVRLTENKKKYLDVAFGELTRNAEVEDGHYYWVSPPFACLVLDTITYRNGNVKYYKVLADQKQVWIHSKDICVL